MDCSCIEAILKWMNLVKNDDVMVNADSIGGIPLQDAEVLGDESCVEEPGEKELNVEEPYKNEADEEELHDTESQDTELQKEIEHPGEFNQLKRTKAANGERRQESKGPECFQEDGGGHLSKSESTKSHQHSQLFIKRRSPDFQDAPFDMDPLVARAYHNLTKSWLLQFPTDILLLVMEQLEDLDLLRLRRACRRFMILFGSRTFKQNHHDLHYVFWQQHEVWQSSLAVGADKGVCTPDELLEEIFCSTCFTARKSRSAGGPTPELDLLHCGGCGNHHQAQAFSATQRKIPLRERICIGREGRFNLCEHVSLSWNDVVKTRESGDTKVAECNHPSHDFAPDHRSSRDRCTEKPRAELEIRENGTVELYFRNTTHVLLDKQDRDRPTAQQLRRRLREIERISPCPWYPLDFPRISPMRLVDPNLCLCLEYEGADRIDWHLRGPRGYPETGKGLQERCWSRSKAGHDAEPCHQGAHSNYINYPDGYISGYFVRCRDGCARLILDKRIEFRPQEMKPWAGAWYRALDPLSYELPDFYGVTWCMSKQCRNYIKHRWNHNTSFNILEDGKFDRYRAVIQDCNENCDAWDEQGEETLILQGSDLLSES